DVEEVPRRLPEDGLTLGKVNELSTVGRTSVFFSPDKDRGVSNVHRGTLHDGHGATQLENRSSSVTSPAFVLVETSNESVCGGTVVSAKMDVVVALLLKLYRAEGSPSCEAQPNTDGTFSFSVKGQKGCADYSWKVNILPLGEQSYIGTTTQGNSKPMEPTLEVDRANFSIVRNIQWCERRAKTDLFRMNQRGRTMMLVVALLLKLYRAEGSPSCEAQPNTDGTFSFSVKGQKDCAEYSWKVNGTTVAYKENFSRPLVQDYSRDDITFKSCQTGVAYFCDRETTITCDRRNQDNNNSIIAITLIILIAVIAFVSWRKCKKCK
ncbi:hypothetical protein NFI96_006929, partial [Prochilodus magdalenae]